VKILRDEDGQSLVISAIFLALAAIGFLSLAVDTGRLFDQKRAAQAAADAAALAAAEEVSAGDSSNEQAVANAVATLNGFNTGLATNPATVTLSTPTTGNYTGSAYIQATVSQPIPTGFPIPQYRSRQQPSPAAANLARPASALKVRRVRRSI
jgi:uncharacterized membrane protein